MPDLWYSCPGSDDFSGEEEKCKDQADDLALMENKACQRDKIDCACSQCQSSKELGWSPGRCIPRMPRRSLDSARDDAHKSVIIRTGGELSVYYDRILRRHCLLVINPSVGGLCVAPVHLITLSEDGISKEEAMPAISTSLPFAPNFFKVFNNGTQPRALFVLSRNFGDYNFPDGRLFNIPMPEGSTPLFANPGNESQLWPWPWPPEQGKHDNRLREPDRQYSILKCSGDIAATQVAAAVARQGQVAYVLFRAGLLAEVRLHRQRDGTQPNNKEFVATFGKRKIGFKSEDVCSVDKGYQVNVVSTAVRLGGIQAMAVLNQQTLVLATGRSLKTLDLSLTISCKDNAFLAQSLDPFKAPMMPSSIHCSCH